MKKTKKLDRIFFSVVIAIMIGCIIMAFVDKRGEMQIAMAIVSIILVIAIAIYIVINTILRKKLIFGIICLLFFITSMVFNIISLTYILKIEDVNKRLDIAYTQNINDDKKEEIDILRDEKFDLDSIYRNYSFVDRIAFLIGLCIFSTSRMGEKEAKSKESQ